MYGCELDHKEGWVAKNWCFWTVVLEKTLENPLDSKIKPVNPKGNQPWIFIGRMDPEAPILWPPDEKSWLIRKDPDARKGWRQEEKGAAEDEMVGWHHWLNGHESEQTLGDSEGRGSLVPCCPWGCKGSDMTEWLDNRAANWGLGEFCGVHQEGAGPSPSWRLPAWGPRSSVGEGLPASWISFPLEQLRWEMQLGASGTWSQPSCSWRLLCIYDTGGWSPFSSSLAWGLGSCYHSDGVVTSCFSGQWGCLRPTSSWPLQQDQRPLTGSGQRVRRSLCWSLAFAKH